MRIRKRIMSGLAIATTGPVLGAGGLDHPVPTLAVSQPNFPFALLWAVTLKNDTDARCQSMTFHTTWTAQFRPFDNRDAPARWVIGEDSLRRRHATPRPDLTRPPQVMYGTLGGPKLSPALPPAPQSPEVRRR